MRRTQHKKFLFAYTFFRMKAIWKISQYNLFIQCEKIFNCKSKLSRILILKVTRWRKKGGKKNILYKP